MSRLRTSADEQARYAAVQAQIKQLLDDAVNDTSPATALLRAQLVAEMYTRNEATHTNYLARLNELQTKHEEGKQP